MKYSQAERDARGGGWESVIVTTFGTCTALPRDSFTQQVSVEALRVLESSLEDPMDAKEVSLRYTK